MSRHLPNEWSKLDSLTLSVVALLPFLVFPFALRGDVAIVKGDALIDLAYRVEVARRVFHGELPFWLPGILGGADLWSYSPTGVLNPLTYLFGVLPIVWTLNITTLLVYSMALAGVYVFARLWGIGRIGSATAGVCYAFSGFFYSYHDLAIHGMAQAAAVAPFLWAAYLYLGERPGPKRAALAAMATLWLGVVPQEQLFFYAMLQACFLTFVASTRAKAADRRKVWLWAAAAATLGTLAFSVRILPAMDLIRHSARDEIALMGERADTLMGVVKWHTIFNPFEGADKGKNIFFGETPLFLALFGLLHFFKNRKIQWAAAGLAIGAVGVFIIIIPESFFAGIPVLGWFRESYRHSFEALFWGAVLAGMGLESLVGAAGDGGRRAQLRKAAIALCATLLPAAGLTAIFHITRCQALVETLKSSSFISLVTLAGVGVFSMATAGRGKTARRLLTAALMVAIFVPRQLIWTKVIDERIVKNGPVDASVIRRNDMVKFLKRRELMLGHPPPLYRALYIGHLYDIDGYLKMADRFRCASPNNNVFFHLDMVTGKNEFAPKRLEDMLRRSARMGYFLDPSVLDISGFALDLLNARYVIFPNNFPSVRSPELWNAYRTYAEDNMRIYNAPKTGKMDSGGPFRLIWEGTGDERRVRILVRAAGSGPGEALEAAISEAGERDFAAAAHPSEIKPQKILTGAPGPGQPRFFVYETAIPHPEQKGPRIMLISASPNGVAPPVKEAALLDKSGSVIRRLPLFEDHIASELGYERIYYDRWVSVYERPSPFPRQWLASRIRVLPPERIAADIARATDPESLDWDIRRTALVENNDLRGFEKKLLATHPDPGARVTRTADSPNFISARVSGDSPVFAVFSEAWAKGWRATLDGKPTPIYQTYLYLRGVAAPAGKHVIEMRYTPPGFAAGLAVSLAALVAIGAMFAAGIRQGGLDDEA